MGLASPIWQLARERLPRGRMLSFGCPDALFAVPGLPTSKHAAEIRALHGVTVDSPDPVALFASEGWSLEVIDAFPTRGLERPHDLNEALPEDLVGQFDAVLDVGTGEHVFNIAAVFASALRALRIGGAVLMEHPLVHCNHGFWAVQPTAVLDFFGANGCQVEAWVRVKGQMTPANTRRFSAPDKAQTVCVATKVADVPLRWPVQWRYA